MRTVQIKPGTTPKAVSTLFDNVHRCNEVFLQAPSTNGAAVNWGNAAIQLHTLAAGTSVGPLPVKNLQDLFVVAANTTDSFIISIW